MTSPFLLIARIEVKPIYVKDYLELASITDKAVMDSEPGMLHHSFDKDPEHSSKFTWSEVYKSEEALLEHLSNPVLAVYLNRHKELADSLSLEIYGKIGLGALKALEATSLPLRIYETKFGFSKL